MKHMLTLFALSLGLTGLLRADNASEAAAYEQALADSFKAAGGVLAEPLGKGLGFAAGSQSFSPVKSKPFMGFNVGLGAGVTATKVDKVAANNTASGGTDLTAYLKALPDSIPVPLAQVNGHFGLPKFLFFESLDLGLRATFLNIQDATTYINLSGFGGEIRGNVLEFPAVVSLGLGVEALNSTLKTRSALASYTGSYGAASITGLTGYGMDVESSVTVTTLRAAVSRKLMFVTPYLGAAFNYNAGETTVRGSQESQITFNGAGGGPVTLIKTIEGKGKKPVPPVDLRLAGGLEFGFWVMYIALGGEYGLLSGGGGGHFQLGVNFR